MEVIIALIVLVALLVAGVPIAASAGLAGLSGFLLAATTKATLSAFSTIPWSVTYNYPLTVIPLFIIMGYLAFHAGITRQAFTAASKWVGRLPGGLAVAVVVASAGFAACSGSSVATTATMTRISVPELRRYKYDDLLSVGAVAAGGTLGVLIPPSLLLVLYGAATMTSVGKLLVAGILPGILTTVMFAIQIMIRAKSNPKLGPPITGVTWKERVRSLKGVSGILILFSLVMCGIYLGIFTPTEAGCIGAFGALVLALVFRTAERKPISDISWLKETLWDASATFSSLFYLIMGIFIFAHFLSYSGVPVRAAEFVSTLALPRELIMLCMFILYLILGCFLDPVGIMLLTLPVVFPIVTQLGYDPVWFGVILVKLCEIAYVTPPVGLNLFVISSLLPETSVDRVAYGALPFVITDLITLAILFVFPAISLYLPSTMG